MLPHQSIESLVTDPGLTLKDAKTLVSLDSGKRLDYYDEVLDELGCSIDTIERAVLEAALRYRANSPSATYLRERGITAANWFDFLS